MTATSRKDGAGRTISIAVGAVVIGIVGWMTWEGIGARSSAHPVTSAASAVPSSTSTAPVVDAGLTVSSVGEPDAGLFLPTLSLGDAGIVMPATAPRTVKIGVVLVTFAGAEGAPPNARSKKDALATAERLGAEAKSDFHHAVSSGDSGSADDIGRLPRGVLDPRTEVAVFGLSAGDISDVLETPRGYWIVKRIE